MYSVVSYVVRADLGIKGMFEGGKGTSDTTFFL